MQENIEQDMIQMLRNLPIAVVVTNRTDAGQERYIWQCLEGVGTATSLTDAANQALCFLIGRIASPIVRKQFIHAESYVHDWQGPQNKRVPY
jgi:hypothetical protein